MKKLVAATAMVVALLSGAGAATAGTYQGVATHNGTVWSVTWDNVSPTCSNDSIESAATAIAATVDGINTSLRLSGSIENRLYNWNLVQFHPSPAGNMTKLTFRGQGSFQCDGHTFLLPGYVAPPAPIPTLSEWAMILLGVMLAGGAALTLQRRRAQIF